MWEKPDPKPQIQPFVPNHDPWYARLPMTPNQADELRRKNPPKPRVQTTEEKSLGLVHAAGLPKAAAALVRRVLVLEEENFKLSADLAELQKRLALLERKR